MSRTVAVARMHLVDRATMFLLPLGILASSFIVNLVIWQYVPSDSRVTGGLISVHIYVLVAAVLAVARGLYFALGMGASRRAFALGTGLSGLVVAATFGTFMVAMSRLEDATGGWWVNGHFFTLPWLADQSLGALWLLFTVSVVAAYLVGAWSSAIWVRWGGKGMFVASVATLGAVALAVVVISRQRAWAGVGEWLVQQTPLSVSGWCALVSVALGAAGYLTLRRVSV